MVNVTDAKIKNSDIYTETGNNTVMATDESVTVALAGAFQWAGSYAVGGAVGVNTLVHTTAATIDNSTVDAGNDIVLTARDISIVANIAAGVQVSTKENESGSVGGSLAVNILVKSTKATAKDATLDAGNDVKLSAIDHSYGGAIAGGIQYSAGFAAGAAISVNTVVTDVDTEINHSTATAGGDVVLFSENESGIGALAIGVQFARSKLALGGSVAVNTAVENTAAVISSGSVITAQGDIIVDAHDWSLIIGLAGGVQIASSYRAGGAAVAVNTIVAPVLAKVDNSILNAKGKVDVDAHNQFIVANIAAGIQGGKDAVAGASVGVNTLVNTTEALIQNNSVVNADEDVTLNASDASYVGVLAGSITAGTGNVAAGAAVSVNTLVNDGTAAIDSSDVISGGQVVLDAKNESLVFNAAVGVQWPNGWALGGSVAVNTLVRNTEARISGTTADPSEVLAWGISIFPQMTYLLWAVWQGPFRIHQRECRHRCRCCRKHGCQYILLQRLRMRT